MRIAESSMSLQSSRAAGSYRREELQITAWEEPPEDRVELSEAAPAQKAGGRELGKDLSLKEWMEALLWEAFFGEGEEAEKPGVRAHGDPDHARGGGRGRSGVEVHFERIAYEAEAVSVTARGSVTTADGRRIDLALQLDLQREHLEHETLDIAIGGRRKDPLVINLSTPTAALTGPRLQFDLDGDGRQERIATPGAGSGFLALDLNANGKVDDGTELLGPRTNDGFGELSALDQDGDGWIDEDDAGWSKLRVWDTSTGSLLDLREAGVGAIFTGAVSSEFALGQTAATAAGFVAETGVFLHEDGRVGTVQHVDLVV